MLTIYLCDDNEVILHKYKNSLYEIAKAYEFVINILTFTSGEQLLFHMEDAIAEAQIIYLDILMNGENGLIIAQKLRNMGCLAEIIFLTANPEYVFDSFDVSPAHYILKGSVTKKRFEDIFLKTACIAEKKSKSVFLCENNHVKKQILISEITYFEVQNRLVTVYYDNTSFQFYARMADIEERLKSRNFLRVHRSYFVHLVYVEQLTKNSLLLITGKEIPVGVTYRNDIKTSLSHYLNLFL